VPKSPEDMVKECFTDNCRRCGHDRLVKYGKTRHGNQRFKCCGCQKVMNAPTQKGRSAAQKSSAIVLYTMFAASFRGIGRFLKVSDVAVGLVRHDREYIIELMMLLCL
jgi:transposase-like protein